MHVDMQTARRPTFKRRKLLVAASPQTVDIFPLVAIPPSSAADTPAQPLVTKAPICNSCHRAFTARPSHLVTCARCCGVTCAICARTCSACPPSAPPTPALSFSPTPPTTPLPSPRRSALALHTNTLAFMPGRRRKVREDEEERVEGEEGCAKEAQPGCGRTICKDCCFENPQSDATTCYDCCGRPHRAAPHTQAQDFGFLQAPLSVQ